MPSAPLPEARLIVNERTGEWGVAWKRLPGLSKTAICQTRSLVQCRRELAASPASVVALEASAENLPAVISALVEWSRRFPQARFIVLAARNFAASESLLREAGAVHAVFSPARLASAIRLVRRHLAAVPRQELTLRETIGRGLPWAGSATSG